MVWRVPRWRVPWHKTYKFSLLSSTLPRSIYPFFSPPQIKSDIHHLIHHLWRVKVWVFEKGGELWKLLSLYSRLDSFQEHEGNHHTKSLPEIPHNAVREYHFHTPRFIKESIIFPDVSSNKERHLIGLKEINRRRQHMREVFKDRSIALHQRHRYETGEVLRTGGMSSRFENLKS